MTESQYSLRWNDHQNHILDSVFRLLQSENFVDVTLACADASIRAHRVVLSACSPLFQRILSENPCSHPIVVLKDYQGWEVQALLNFIYKGEVSILPDQLKRFMKAAEGLQIRGLIDQDAPYGVDRESTSIVNQTPTPSSSPNDCDRSYYNNKSISNPEVTERAAADLNGLFSPVSGQNNFESPVKLPDMARLSFQESFSHRQECRSPMPRRKQARPRRRSGELCTAQDLSTGPAKPASPCEETAENLCTKKQDNEMEMEIKEEANCKSPELSDSPMLDMSSQCGNDFRPTSVNAITMHLRQELNNHSPVAFQPMPPVSALAMTQSHTKYFGLESHPALFTSPLEGYRFDRPDHRITQDPHIYTKKKTGRPKGQHSAPRGGPPRSWTNGELTEALQHVWNRKMTTSQASRLFGIPYNSLLMYVRGKYGKSLKLEQLRRDCARRSQSPVDIPAGNKAHNPKNDPREQEPLPPNTRPSSRENQPPQAPIFNPFPPGFFPDFGAGFQIPVNMVHLLPASEKSREQFVQQQQALEEECKERSNNLEGGSGNVSAVNALC